MVPVCIGGLVGSDASCLISLEGVATLSAVVQAVVAIVLVIAGLLQLRAIRRQIEAGNEQTRLVAEQTRLMALQQAADEERERKWRTLSECNRYDSDPVIHEATVKLWEHRLGRSGTPDPRVLKPYAATILNYLDSLAIGVNQGLYIDALIKDHMAEIVRYHVANHLNDAFAAACELNRNDYLAVLAMERGWSALVRPEPSYKA
jgi:type II secretory pathway pseudopilin PulG